MIDHSQRDLYQNLFTQTEQPTVSDSLTFSTVSDTIHPTTRIEKAKKLYHTIALPTPHYETNSDVLRNLVEIRIHNNLYPGQHFPTGIEEYSHATIQAQGTNALCATGTISQLKTANIRSSSMWKFFGMQGKDTRKLAQLLSHYGWESIVKSTDSHQYYKQRANT